MRSRDLGTCLPGGPKPPAVRGSYWDRGPKSPWTHISKLKLSSWAHATPALSTLCKFTGNLGTATHQRVIFQEAARDLAGVPRVLTKLPGPGRKQIPRELSGSRRPPPAPQPAAPLLTLPPSTSPAHRP